MPGALAAVVGEVLGIFDVASKHCCVYIYALCVGQCSVSQVSAIYIYM